MFCYQCQETLKNQACRVNGVCGKRSDTAALQDVLIYVAKGLSVVAEKSGAVEKATGHYIMKALFVTITNANFDNAAICDVIREGLKLRDKLRTKYNMDGALGDIAEWSGDSEAEFLKKAETVGITAAENEDVRSLREMVVYGLKGICAYGDHARILGYEEQEVYDFLVEGLASTTRELSLDEMVAMVLKTGDVAVKVMALLDKANSETYGNPEISEVNIGVGKNPGILISGHDLKDMQELLEQTQGTGVDVYTHCEMLAANYYPAFKKYDNFIGNYGNSWPQQNREFETFNGPVLMTTNCIIPPKDSYKQRVFTTGCAGFAGVKHIPDRPEGGSKDFSAIIEMAKTCPQPEQIEEGTIVGGFAHNQVMALADKVVEAVKSGAVRKFVVMAGCDGRQSGRSYYTEFAEKLPKDTIILTAGCAKYRYNKLKLGDIGGIPRILDAGQCNDSYSLAFVALKLKGVFGLDDINELPIVYNIAWYEQKACTVLLALLALGVKNIHLGPTLPAFVSPNVLKVLVDKFGIQPISSVDEDMAKLVG